MPRSISPATAMTRVRPASLGLEMKGPEVVVKPDYNVAIGAAALAGGLFAARAPVVAVPIAALAALFAVQAGRVRFTFDDEVPLFCPCVVPLPPGICLLCFRTHVRLSVRLWLG